MEQSQSNIEVIEAALTAIQNGDLDGALGRFDEEVRWGAAQWLPHAGLYDGRDAIRGMLEGVRERFAGGYRFLNLTVYGTPDHAFAEVTRTGGDNAYAEGSEHVMLEFHLVMGKIREVREFAFKIH